MLEFTLQHLSVGTSVIMWSSQRLWKRIRGAEIYIHAFVRVLAQVFGCLANRAGRLDPNIIANHQEFVPLCLEARQLQIL